jgi:cellulose synthase/poly-beta-1,6-N-acetylglucosamine synthase-like glycosyltransferase
MSIAENVFLALYFAVLAVLAVYGTHRYRMAYLFFRHRFALPAPVGRLEQLPKVTIQLPLYNEEYVVERLVDAVCQIDYPGGLLEVQVLDDSTDDTTTLAKARVAHWRSRGVDVVYLQRPDRVGFKAGALEYGLARAKGEYVAVFDADFVPAPDFLKKTVAYFADPTVAMVQVRWGHLNREFNLLTRAQSILLDGHFIIEHTARNRSGLFFNFNGTAGIWRKAAITDAGGWQHDTLTEDLDLSYRAQLKGWRFVFLADVFAPAEVPVDMRAFKSQQHRWAKGSIQTAKKLIPLIRHSKLPFDTKLEAFFHLTNNIAYPLMVALAVMMPLSMVVRFNHGAYSTMFLDMPVFTAATASITLFYFVTMRELGYSWLGILVYLPFVMSLGIGMAVNQCRAVAEALLDQPSDFARTPKTGSEGKSIKSVKKAYLGRTSWVPLIELAFAVYYAGALYYAWDLGIWSTIPFLLLFLVGFLYVGMSTLVDVGLRSRIAAAFRTAVAQPAA